MAYITNDDIEQRLGGASYVHLTDDDGDNVADAGVVDEARLGAEGEVDSHLARRFRVPINTTAHPELAGVLASITLDLVEYRLRARRPPLPAEINRRRDDAVEWLTRVADGRLTLPSATPVATRDTSDVIATTTGEPRLLSRDELSNH